MNTMENLRKRKGRNNNFRFPEKRYNSLLDSPVILSSYDAQQTVSVKSLANMLHPYNMIQSETTFKNFTEIVIFSLCSLDYIIFEE